MKFSLQLLLILLLVFSCGSYKKTKTRRVKKEPVINKHKSTSKKQKQSSRKVTLKDTPELYNSPTEEYIAIFSDIAENEMRQYKIPASITLAQGILESASGKGRLAVKANNHFGIKCHNWKGSKIYHDDDASQECFRKYKNAKYSFRDHSLFLSKRKRYQNLFNLKPDDYIGWAKGLRSAGYATDRKYPQKLISLIERYQLFRFDAEVLGTNLNNNDKHIVVKGDTLYSISKKHNISVEKLKALNGLESSTLFVGQILYTKPLPKDY